MLTLVVRVYEYFRRHRMVCGLSFLLVTVVLSFLLASQTYKEDISDFLPLNNKYNEALKVYQDISGANRLFVIVQHTDSAKEDPDSLVWAVNAFVDRLKATEEGARIGNLTYQVDLEQVAQMSSYVYRNIPYFLTESDYQRLDSLLDTPGYVASQMANDKEMLMFPVAGLLAENFQRDPLNLFTPVVARLRDMQPDMSFENYDGYIFSPDMKRAIIAMETPYGASETEKNGALLRQLEACARQVTQQAPQISIHVTGGPAIAVGNADRIKTDSMISIGVAVVLIVLLLSYVFRKVWNILLIIVSIGWGWLFAMGALSLIHDSVSVIVIGISSVILGIAVNYPLHLIAHLQHTPNVKSALREIAVPLIVGNVTTVGAFLALVPLKSVALRDLGLFSSLLLVGTIVFVLLYLPHLLKAGRPQKETFIARIGNYTIDNKRWIVYVVLALTVVFAYYSLDTVFDSDMKHINYMSEAQKEDFQYFQSLLTSDTKEQKVYVVHHSADLDSSLENSRKFASVASRLANGKDIVGYQSCSQFLCSREEQQRRLARWSRFVKSHGDDIVRDVRGAARKEGFREDTFDEFFDILSADYKPEPASYFSPLATTVFAANLATEAASQTCNVVDVLSTDKDNVAEIIAKVERDCPSCYAFDVQSMNSSIATRLSDDFNYIGWACGLIVFFFLWFSFGSIELAMLSFLPMAISWIWILGIMSLLGIHFNVVNVILATFIFGQGDDYTIFMTEGCQYEYAYRRKMLASYKNSIIISALIMFIGIGSLIVARHPALHSLAEVTIVGMFSVVLMAYLFPPLIYKWLVSKRGEYRVRPVSLKALFVTGYSAAVFFCQLATVYVLGFVLFVVLRPGRWSKRFFRGYIRRCFRFDMNSIWGVRFTCENDVHEDFSKPAVVVCNHQSMLDTAFLMAMSSKIVIVANEHASSHLVTRKVFEWMDFYTIPDGKSPDEQRLAELIGMGYSIVIFPEGQRNADSSILRFHKGAFYFAEKHHLDIVPVLIHGANYVFPRNTICTYPGKVTLSIRERIRPGSELWGTDYAERTKNVRHYFLREYESLRRQNENADYYAPLVMDRYRYKGHEIYGSVRKSLRSHDNYARWIDGLEGSLTVVVNSGWGELPLLVALAHPGMSVVSVENDAEKQCVARYAAERIAPDISYCSSMGASQLRSLEQQHKNINVIILGAASADLSAYEAFNPIVI